MLVFFNLPLEKNIVHKNSYLKFLPLLLVLFLAGCSISREPVQIGHYQESINVNKDIALPDKPLLDDYVLYALKKSSNLQSCLLYTSDAADE